MSDPKPDNKPDKSAADLFQSMRLDFDERDRPERRSRLGLIAIGVVVLGAGIAVGLIGHHNREQQPSPTVASKTAPVPAPAQPAPTQPAPTQPAPTQPAPAQQQAAQTPPAEPAAPAPAQTAPAGAAPAQPPQPPAVAATGGTETLTPSAPAPSAPASGTAAVPGPTATAPATEAPSAPAQPPAQAETQAPAETKPAPAKTAETKQAEAKPARAKPRGAASASRNKVASAPAGGGATAWAPGGYSVQVGTFQVAANADSMKVALAHHGYEAAVVPWTDGAGHAWHAVRVGHFASRGAAESFARRLAAAAKVPAIVVDQGKK